MYMTEIDDLSILVIVYIIIISVNQKYYFTTLYVYP